MPTKRNITYSENLVLNDSFITVQAPEHVSFSFFLSEPEIPILKFSNVFATGIV
jgi:hypothetical protein